ncbi:MAG: flagellar filament capping protein FliD [candidate division Zixibacteria bacterium]|nr:flagellar filament capping protein FliD [candidate division Zixibacteria bacterium]
MPSFSIDGISSGIDTTSYVDAIIEFERRPAVLMEQEQAEKTNIISSLKALQAKILALATEATRLTRASSFEAASINISDDTVISATSSGRVSTGSYDLKVLSLARNHQLASQGFSDQSLSSFGTGTITLSVGDDSPVVVTVDAGNNSLVGIKNAINNSKAGVTATIINDGSSSNAYRLILTADDTGATNTISVTSALTGGNNLNFDTALFDTPELLNMNSGSDAVISLGSTAAFTGNKNKIYTFTVAGTGSQTVGSDNITVNWTDGTNSGTILVTQADTEVELVGDGADGLKMTFSAGELNTGDTFQVSTFAPLLQEASDATLAIGSSGGNGSPITITSSTNTFRDVIGGLTLTVQKETGDDESVNITTDVDVAGIKSTIQAFIQRYNDVIDYIDEQNTYNTETKESGVLFGDYSIQTMQNSLRRTFTSKVEGIDSQYNQLYAIGIRTGTDGKLSISDSSRFEKAVRENLDDVIKLFTNSGTGTNNSISFISSTADTVIGEYEVDITRAATRGRFQGGGIADPALTPITLNSTNNRLKLVVDGLESNEIVLTEKTYNSSEELISELQSKIDNDEKIGSRGLTVEWVSTGNTGYLNLVSSTYGSGSKVNIKTSIANTAYTALGLLTGVNFEGLDVQGTINGEEAVGHGRFLTGKEGNACTEGLKLEITLDASDLVDGPEGTISLSKGSAAKLDDLLDSLTRTSDGFLDSRIRSYQKQVDYLKERVAEFDERLAVRRDTLLQQFYRMEEILGELNSQNEYLTSQLDNINVNWKFNN